MNRWKTINFGIAVAVLLSSALLLGSPVKSTVKAGDITGGEVGPHVNIAAFHKLHGQESFKFPDHISDHDILGALKGKAQYIFMNHTSGLKDGDVIIVSIVVIR